MFLLMLLPKYFVLLISGLLFSTAMSSMSSSRATSFVLLLPLLSGGRVDADTLLVPFQVPAVFEAFAASQGAPVLFLCVMFGHVSVDSHECQSSMAT